ncbi:3039_t:CDS:2, partial [Funneliformis mosseae]
EVLMSKISTYEDEINEYHLFFNNSSVTKVFVLDLRGKSSTKKLQQEKNIAKQKFSERMTRYTLDNPIHED